MIVAVDTSVVVAALLSWHDDHEPARTALDRALVAGHVKLPGPVLIESYAVTTRLPAPHRISPADARALLSETFQDVEVVTLTPRELWGVVERLERNRVAGGRVYDAQILACAIKARSSALLTLNERDFLSLEPGDVEIRNPAAR